MEIRSKYLYGLARSLAFGSVLGLAAIYPFLEHRLAAEGTVQSTVFHAAYGLTLIALVWVAAAIPAWIAIGHDLWKRMPFRSALLIINVLITVTLLFTIFTQWGVIMTLLFGSLILLRFQLLSKERRHKALASTTRWSFISFGMVYFVLATGEVYFRFNPEQVGGGGGGNPALRQLYSGLYKLNSFDLRGDEFPLKPAEGNYRILVLGDSFAYGQGVPLEETFPHQVEKLLNDEASSRGFEVINAGNCGANTKWELDYLNTRGWDFEPDMVVLQFFANDIERSAQPEEISQNKILELFFRKPLQRSYVIFFLRYHFDQFLHSLHARADENVPQDWLWGLAREVEVNGAGWQECRQSLEGFASACKEKGMPAVVVLFPHPGKPHDAVPIIHNAVVEHCRKVGLASLDLIDEMKGLDHEKQIVTEFDHHPSGDYHSLAARCLVDSLQESLPEAD